MINRVVGRYALVACIVFLSSVSVFAQDKQDPPEVLNRQTDAIDVIKSIFSKKKGTNIDTVKKKHSTFSILPSAGYNPSVGFSVGVTSTGGKVFGDPKTTTFSVFNANAYTSTLGLSSFEFKNNVFTNHDKFNLQGSLQVGTTVALDYGIGTGQAAHGEGSFSINGFPLENNADVFPIGFSYVKFNERVYKEIFKNVYAGAGLSFNFYNDIDDERLIGPNFGTHNFRYSTINGYPTQGYKANGILLNIEYNSRDHINRPYRGLYIDLVLRFNETWLGSNKYANQFKTELRKYWSLSKKNPEHVLAYWFWGTYLLGGSIPYLELVGTGSDAAGRMGRAYTIGRFKGSNFAYSELEYRFPITKNKLLSGVAFANAQTASNLFRRVRLLDYFEPGGGVGLRLLFNKYSRSSLCIDYGRGMYGSTGLFLGLNEVF